MGPRARALGRAVFAGALLALAGPAPARDARALPSRALAPADGWTHDWARGAVFYEVFVRSFADSDADGIGDLRGLASRLDHLRDGDPATDGDLEVDALWLMPVFESPSDHGYDVADYDRVERDYGTDDDLRALLDEAHRRGLRVIVDLVLNHTSSRHPWFLDSAAGAGSARRDWYVWSPGNPGWTQPWSTQAAWHPLNGAYYYGLFWSEMPDLNLANPAVREALLGVVDRWLALGVDGFRLDASRYLVETGPGGGQQDTAATHAVLRELAAHVRTARPDAFLVGENWADTRTIATYYGTGGDELPASFDFPLAERILAAVRQGDASAVAALYAALEALYPPGSIDAPFLTNHDQVRLATQLGNSPAALRSAASVLLTLPGAVFLYYGEEVGMQNGQGSGDEAKRTPMPWDGSANGGFTAGTPWSPLSPGNATANVASQTGDPGSLLSRYRALTRARHASPALRDGVIRMLSSPTAPSPVLAFVRETAGERVLVAHNLSDAPAAAGPWPVQASGAEAVLADAGATVACAPDCRVGLPARATGAWLLH